VTEVDSNVDGELDYDSDASDVELEPLIYEAKGKSESHLSY